MRCPNCNMEIDDNSTVCPNCGFELNNLEHNHNFEEQSAQPNFDQFNFVQNEPDFQTFDATNQDFNNQDFDATNQEQAFDATNQGFDQSFDSPNFDQKEEEHKHNADDFFNDFDQPSHSQPFNEAPQEDQTNKTFPNFADSLLDETPQEQVHETQKFDSGIFDDIINEQNQFNEDVNNATKSGIDFEQIKKENQESQNKGQNPVEAAISRGKKAKQNIDKNEKNKNTYSPFLQIPIANRYYFGKLFNYVLFAFSSLCIVAIIAIAIIGPVFTVNKTVIDLNTNEYKFNSVPYFVIDIFNSFLDMDFIPLNTVKEGVVSGTFLTTFSTLRIVSFILFAFSMTTLGAINIFKNTYAIKNNRNVTLDFTFVAALLSLPYVLCITIPTNSYITATSSTYIKESIELGYGSLGLLILLFILFFLYGCYDIYKINLSRDRYSISACVFRNVSLALSVLIVIVLLKKRTLVYSGTVSNTFNANYSSFINPSYSEAPVFFYLGSVFFALELACIIFSIVLYMKYSRRNTFIHLYVTTSALLFNILNEVFINYFIAANNSGYNISISPNEILAIVTYSSIIILLTLNIIVKRQRDKLDSLIEKHIKTIDYQQQNS